MKIYLILFLSLVCTSLAFAQADIAQVDIAQADIPSGEYKIVYVTSNVLNVRDKPTLKGKVLAKLSKNSRQIVSQKQGDWFLLKSDLYPEAWIAAQHTSSIKPKYSEFINAGAINPYLSSDPQAQVIKKQNKSLNSVNHNRQIAAYMALDSGKCDLVTGVEILDTKNTEYLVQCENKALIKLMESSISNGANAKQIVTEKEKAIPREVARNRCEGKIKNQLVYSDSIIIEPYGTSTWITAKGETLVSMIFSMKNSSGIIQERVAKCIFRYNDRDSINITKK